MSEQEIKILVSRTLIEIYDKIDKNNLTEDEANFFINSILYEIALGVRNDAYKKMKGNI